MEFTNIQNDPEMIRRIRRSKREMRLLGMTSIVLAVLSGYFSAGYPWLGLVLFCCTPLSLYLIARHKDILTPYMDPSRGLSGVFFIPLIVAAGLMAACNFIEILHFVDILAPAALIFAALTWLMWKCIRRFTVKKAVYTVSAVMLLAFVGNGTYLTLLLNKLLSNNAPAYYEAIVVEKKPSTGGAVDSYTLEIGPWEHSPENEHVAVRKSVFLMLREKGRAGLHYQKGALGIPWFEVVDRR